MFTNEIPFGVVGSLRDEPDVKSFVVTAYKDVIIDLYALNQVEPWLPDALATRIFLQDSLNAFLRAGKRVQQATIDIVRQRIDEDTIPDEAKILHKNATLILPVKVGDYTDFYASKEHATNVGKLFRPNNPLLPNWVNIPIAYHGRSSSIVVSGTDIKHPWGMITLEGQDVPQYQQSQRLDYELELGFVVGKDSTLGTPVKMEEAEDYIFGVVILNDWSARDIQKYEYVPLGPFLGKNFATSISAWVIPLQSLQNHRTSQVAQEPTPQPHLCNLSDTVHSNDAFDIELKVTLVRDGKQHVLCETNSKYLYWSVKQMVVHHTSNGCNLRVGDIIATGTISGDTEESLGSMLELTKGKGDMLRQGDTILMEGRAGNLHLGDCFGTIV